MQILSIQTDGPYLRAALIDKKKNRAEIRALQSAPLSHPDNVKQLYIPSFKGQIISGLSGKDLLIRSVELKIGKSRYLEQVLSFQSEATSFFPSEEVMNVPYFLKKEKKGTEALLFSVSKQGLKEHLEALEKLQLDPEIVSSWSFGLVRYIQWKQPTLSNAFLVDLASNEWTCVWMEKGEIKKSYVLEGGVETLFTAFWEDQKKILLLKELEGIAKQTDLFRLKPPDLPHFYKKLDAMRKELAKVILSFHHLGGPRPILFTGRADAFHHFRDFLIEDFREAISAERAARESYLSGCGKVLAAPYRSGESPSLEEGVLQCNSSFPAEELKYAVCIGLALDPSLQLRQGEFFPKKSWRKAGQKALFLFSFSLFLSAALLFLGAKISRAQTEALSSSLKTAIHLWDPTLRETKSTNLEEGLHQWTMDVDSYSKEYPYLMQAPRVAEVLSWLTVHPIHIRALHYQLLQFPRIDSLNDPYRTKVELEFEAQSPMIARKFHEFLLQEAPWIDPKEEISWEALNDGYHVSFFLKTRSP